MSTEVAIVAISHNGLRIDGEHVMRSDIRYTKEWIEKALEQNQDALIEGRLTIACSYDALRWILKAVKFGQEHGMGVFVTDGDDIFATQEILLEVILKYWNEWHAEDPRWSWSQEAIREFFHQYQWAVIYIAGL